MARPSEAVSVTDADHLPEFSTQHQAAARQNRYKAVHKAFNSRVVDGQIVSWEAEMDDYINQFQRENNAILHTVTQAAVWTNYLFIWEMPCP